jgi:hypothetical protein
MKEPVELAPPGAGVPEYQRLTGKYILLPYYSRRWSWDQAVEVTLKEGGNLIDRSRGLSEERLTRRVLVPPQIGLEDSSRYWSYAMVLEHLTILGTIVTRIIVELTHGTSSSAPVSTTELKPAGGQSAASSIEVFRRHLEAFRHGTMEASGDRRSPTRFEHPWFGPLTAHQWICFVPFHQRIHIRQTNRILRD